MRRSYELNLRPPNPTRPCPTSAEVEHLSTNHMPHSQRAPIAPGHLDAAPRPDQDPLDVLCEPSACCRRVAVEDHAQVPHAAQVVFPATPTWP
jgi:hypothetical protein